MGLLFWIIIAVLVLIFWFSMRGRAIRRIEATRDYARRATEQRMRRKAEAAHRNDQKNNERKGEIEEMIQCPKCSDYVSARAANCGREGCPLG